MIKLNKNKIISIALIIIAILSISTQVMAVNPNEVNPGKITIRKGIFITRINGVLGWIQYIRNDCWNNWTCSNRCKILI